MSGYATLAEALARGRGRERAFRCPVHGDRQASASVNVAKGVWVCYACGAKGTTDNVLEPDDATFARDVDELLGFETRTYPEGWLDQFTQDPHPYWLSRFEERTVAHWRLGYDHWRTVGRERVHRPAPCYPMRAPDGTVLGVVYRQLDEMPKYVYPRGVAKSELLHGYTPERRTTVGLVEGAPDVWAAWEAGATCWGLYGAAISDAQITLLHKAGVEAVLLALDNDRAGQRAVHGYRHDEGHWVPGIADRLGAAGIGSAYLDWGGVEAKDVAECDRDTRRTLLDLVTD